MLPVFFLVSDGGGRNFCGYVVKQRAIITYVNFIMVHYADSGSFVMGNRGVLAKESTDNKSVVL